MGGIVSDKVELRFKVDRKIIEDLQRRVNAARPIDVIALALGTYDWVTEEVEEGRRIVSLDSDNKDPVRLHAPEFSNIKRNAAA